MEQSINLTAAAKVPFEAARTALAADPAGVLGGTPVAGPQHFIIELGIELLDGSRLAQDVLVDLAPLSMDAGLARFGVCWQAVGHPELFPVFGGDLELRPVGDGVGLRLSGHYRVPFGSVGRFGEALVGRRLARHTLERLLKDIARGLESVALADGRTLESAMDLTAEFYWG
jgi:hypothetical protein